MVDTDLLLFLATVGFVVIGTVWGIERMPEEDRAAMGLAARRPRSVALAWLILTAVPALVGAFAPAGPVPPQIMLLGIFAFAIWFALAPVGKGLAAMTPLYLLVAFQGFRLPLEMVLHGWVESNVAPPQMTWTGQNIDILSGVAALVSIPLVRKWERLAWVPTAIGVVLLANAVWIVMRSLPGPLQAFPDIITLPNRFPHIWIATVCVPGALAAHIMAIRALLVGSVAKKRPI